MSTPASTAPAAPAASPATWSNAWGKFWRSYTPTKLETASNMAAVLKYLQLCAYSVVTDINRAHAGTHSLDQAPTEQAGTGPTPKQETIAQASRASLWETVGRQLKNEREQVLVCLVFQLGLKSAEIQAARPDQFRTVRDVYTVTRNVLDRLARSPELRQWQQDASDRRQ